MPEAVNRGCAAIPGGFIDVWHCDANGYCFEYKEFGCLGAREAP